MTKLDFRKADKALYTPPLDQWQRVDVPAMVYLSITGQGDPNGPGFAAALGALYPVAYGLKFARKPDGDFTASPLAALWWADDPAAFAAGERAAWRWRAMLRVPGDVDDAAVENIRKSVLAKQASKSGGADPALIAAVTLTRLTEGDCLQRLHNGPFADEAPVLADLHDKVMPRLGLTFAGPHHEIYLSDPRRTAPEKLRTILRQPVKPA